MLIVTNGDMAADRIARLGLDADEILPWRDVLHDGPVPGDVDDAALRSVRAAFLSKMSDQSEADILIGLERRDARLAAAIASERIELWFEDDVYDQLQLAQILSAPGVENADLRLLQAGRNLCDLDDAAFKALPASAVAIDDRMLSRAQSVWDAFRSDTPHALAEAAAERSALPFMDMALKRLLAEYPDRRTGLPCSMQTALEPLERSETTLGGLFSAMQAAEPSPFMGDLSFAWLISELARGGRPLLSAPDGAALRAEPPFDRAFFRQTAALTSFGRAVLAGDADVIAANGVDRWLGGVRLSGVDCARHDGVLGTLVDAAGRPLLDSATGGRHPPPHV